MTHANRDAAHWSIDTPNFLSVNAWNEWSEGSVMEPTLQFGSRFLEKVRSTMLRDVLSGTVSVFLPIALRWSLPRVHQALIDMLTALDAAIVDTPPLPIWAQSALSDSAAEVKLFDYEILVFLHESPYNYRHMKNLVQLVRSISHPRLRFIDTSSHPQSEYEQLVAENAKLYITPFEPQPVDPKTFEHALRQADNVKQPDWLLLLQIDAVVDVMSAPSMPITVPSMNHTIAPRVTEFSPLAGLSKMLRTKLADPRVHQMEVELTTVPSSVDISSDGDGDSFEPKKKSHPLLVERYDEVEMKVKAGWEIWPALTPDPDFQ